MVIQHANVTVNGYYWTWGRFLFTWIEIAVKLLVKWAHSPEKYFLFASIVLTVIDKNILVFAPLPCLLGTESFCNWGQWRIHLQLYLVSEIYIQCTTVLALTKITTKTGIVGVVQTHLVHWRTQLKLHSRNSIFFGYNWSKTRHIGGVWCSWKNRMNRSPRTWFSSQESKE